MLSTIFHEALMVAFDIDQPSRGWSLVAASCLSSLSPQAVAALEGVSDFSTWSRDDRGSPKVVLRVKESDCTAKQAFDNSAYGQGIDPLALKAFMLEANQCQYRAHIYALALLTLPSKLLLLGKGSEDLGHVTDIVFCTGRIKLQFDVFLSFANSGARSISLHESSLHEVLALKTDKNRWIRIELTPNQMTNCPFKICVQTELTADDYAVFERCDRVKSTEELVRGLRTQIKTHGPDYCDAACEYLLMQLHTIDMFTGSKACAELLKHVEPKTRRVPASAKRSPRPAQ